MASELNIFDVSSETPTDSWAHGKVAAQAWLTGSLRAEDGLDISGEFDAQFSARFGTEALKGIASLSGDVTGAAHAGVRLQVGMPLDLFEMAGIVARIRLEASASVRASVTATMSLGEMRGLVTQALPAEARPYVDIVLDEIRVGATVWARASFSAMAISELVAAVDLFPKDGSGPGVTAYFHYGFGWGYGAGWGVITNVGFDLKRMLRRLSDQATIDVRSALQAYRTDQALASDDPRALATELAGVLLPLTLDALVAWCERQLDAEDDDERTSLGESLADAVRALLADAILPRLLEFAGEKLVEDLAQVPPETAHEIWGELAAAGVYLAGAPDEPLEVIGVAAVALTRIAALLPEDVGAPLGSAVRCAAAIAALATDSDDPGLRIVLSTTTAAGYPPLNVLAGLVLADELTTLLVEQDLVPAWVAPLFDSAASLTATLTSDGSAAALTSDEAIDLLHSLLTGLDTMMTDEGLWDRLTTESGFPEMVRAIKAQAKVVTDLCASLKDGGDVDGHATREAVSVAIIMLIGKPLAQVITTVSERGLAQVPPALTALADEVDATSVPTSIEASWEDIARQVVGSSVGFPVAQLMRHAAGTVAQWRETRLPAELKMLRSFLELDLADEFSAVGPAAAVADFKNQLLPILGEHVIDVVLTSHEMVLRDSVNLFRDSVIGTVQHIRRTLELSAIISFRLVEEAISLAERGVTELQQREVELERLAQRYTTDFLTVLSGVTGQIRGLDRYVGAALTDWMVGECIGPAAAADMPDWIRDGLRGIVTAAVNVSSGGVLNALGSALGSIADLIDASAEALRLTAATEEGSLVGVQPLLEALVAGDRLPSVVVPIGFDIPNPIMPFILPGIHVELARVEIPAKALSSVVMTIVFGSVGIAPLIETLNTTATSLRVTKGALSTIRGAIAGSDAQQMRQDLQAARPGEPLAVEVIEPLPAASAPFWGTIAFRIRGANLSFVDPAGAGLPGEAISRVQVIVNGQTVSVSDIQWQETGAGLEGRLEYDGAGSAGRLTVRPGPTAVVVVVADGYGTLSAQEAWHFVVQGAPELQMVAIPVWFPIAAGLLTPVLGVAQDAPVLGGPHRTIEAGDLPVPEVTLDRPGRPVGAHPRRWAQARPGVQVNAHQEPDLPTGYLHLDRLTDGAAAWCTLDGQFGVVEWAERRVSAWTSKLDGPVQSLRAGGDVIAIATAAAAHCFDASCGDLLYRVPLGEGRQRLLDATGEAVVVAEKGRVIGLSPECGELWSVKTTRRLVAGRVCGDSLVLAEEGRVTVRSLADGEERWRARTAGEAVVTGGNLFVPGRGPTSHVYDLVDGVASTVRTGRSVARPAPPAIRMLDGTLVPVVTSAGDVLILDLVGMEMVDRASHTTRPADAAWLAGPFLMTTPALSVTHLWGGVATPIPLVVEAGFGSVVTGPGQAIVRSADRGAWLVFS